MKQFFSVVLYQPLYNALMLLVWLVPGHGVGWAIILLTIIIRLILLPSANKALKAQKEMRDLQPKIQKVQDQHKGNKEAQSRALMDLYKEHKVSPFGSCLPLLIQLPIIWVLYRVFRIGLDTSHFSMIYSFLPHPTAVNTMFMGLNLATPDRWMLPIITGIAQYFQMWQLQKVTGPVAKKDGKQDMAQMMSKQMMYLAPVMTLLIAAKLPSAVVLYWLVTTLFTVVQQWWFFRNGQMKLATAESGAMVDEVGKKESATKSKLPSLKNWRKNDVVVTVRRKGE